MGDEIEFLEELKMLKEQLKFKEKVEVPNNIENVVIAGMGGSGIAGKIFSEFYSKKPVYLVDDYKLPDFVSKSTLVVAISYSGNTEETVSVAKQAIKRGAYTVTITSGGELAGYGDQQIRIPRNDLQPRSATGFMLMPLLRGFGIVSDKEISESYSLLEQLDRNNGKCKEIANDIAKGMYIPIIYGSSPFKSIAYRWKTQFNENAKVMAYSNSFPELNHNDTMSLAKTYRKDCLYFLVFKPTNKRIAKRIDITATITKSNFKIIAPKGSSDIARMFYLLHYGDYLTYYLGVIRGINPTDVSLIEELKRRLGRFKH